MLSALLIIVSFQSLVILGAVEGTVMAKPTRGDNGDLLPLPSVVVLAKGGS